MREKELRRERIRRQKRRRRRRRIRRCIRMLCALFFCVLGIWLFGNVLIDTGALTALGKKMNGSGSLLGSYAAPETLPEESESETYVLRAEAETAAESGLQNADFYNARIETESPKEQDIPSVPEVDLTQLYSPYAILVDPDSGTVIAEKNSRERIYPASLTKIMTAVIVLENMEDLNETIVLPGEMFGTLMVQHASLAGFEPGESVSVKDLLYGILLPSGAECCIACADRIAGSEDAFVELMNAKVVSSNL
ncbi:MAG: hypothetical protein Q4C58_08760 [Eubacteriales bacterium]|nr:hypothetical protein [Eubacteriales bacterium]